MCRKKKWKRTNYEKLTRCLTETAAETIKKSAIERDDNTQLLANISGKDWQSIVAFELQYHHSCYLNYTKRSRSFDAAVGYWDILFKHVDNHVLQNSEVLTLVDLANLMKDGGKDPDVRTISDALKNNFGENIGFWKPSKGSSFIFNNRIEKGNLIEILQEKIECLSYAREPQPIDEKMKEVGKKIRADILSLGQIYPNWPPLESEMFSNKTQLPTTLRLLLTNILAKPGKISERKNMLIESIGEDIIYNATVKIIAHSRLST